MFSKKTRHFFEFLHVCTLNECHLIRFFFTHPSVNKCFMCNFQLHAQISLKLCAIFGLSRDKKTKYILLVLFENESLKNWEIENGKDKKYWKGKKRNSSAEWMYTVWQLYLERDIYTIIVTFPNFLNKQRSPLSRQILEIYKEFLIRWHST